MLSAVAQSTSDIFLGGYESSFTGPQVGRLLSGGSKNLRSMAACRPESAPNGFAVRKLRLLFGMLAWIPVLAAPSAVGGSIDASTAYLRGHFQSPEDYLIGKFRRYDVVLIGEDHAVQQNLALAGSLIPRLYRAGVYAFGMEFGATEDQARLDALVTGVNYDENEARRLMFDYNVRWAYRGYQDLYKAAWQLNRSLPQGARRFRIINLSYRYQWASFTGQRTPMTVSRVFPKGDTERFRADLVGREILAKHEKMLILTGTIHAFTRYEEPDYDYLSRGFFRLEDRYMGERLYRMAPGRVCFIVLHQPFPGRTGGLVSPAGGDIGRVMADLGNRPVGFDLTGTPLGDLPDDSYYATGHPGFRLADLADGYVFLAPFRELRGCAVDDRFLDGQSWPDVRREWPDPDWTPRPADPEQYWRDVRSFADLAERYRNVRAVPVSEGLAPPGEGRLVKYPAFPSLNVPPREVDVWIPPEYDRRTTARYPVIYMQDGQNLFNPDTSFGGVSWSVDKAMLSLIRSGRTQGAIIVGIWNTGAGRAAEYMPAKAVKVRNIAEVAGLVPGPAGPIISDAYLAFMVRELKPFIDRTYRTESGRDHTFVMGSSMGALISAYAVAEYPKIFGAAACLSTHWPAGNGAVIGYLAHHLPRADGHRLYFDFGTQTLDAEYAPYQARMDDAMRTLGYLEGVDWITREFPGAEHSERSWSERLRIPLSFLLDGAGTGPNTAS